MHYGNFRNLTKYLVSSKDLELYSIPGPLHWNCLEGLLLNMDFIDQN